METTRQNKISRLLQKELSDIFLAEAEMIANINANAKTIRYELSQRVRYQLRKTPELSFFLDDSLDYIENIDALLKK